MQRHGQKYNWKLSSLMPMLPPTHGADWWEHEASWHHDLSLSVSKESAYSVEMKKPGSESCGKWQIRTITLSTITLLHKWLPSLYLYHLFWNFNLLLIHKANENVLYSRGKGKNNRSNPQSLLLTSRANGENISVSTYSLLGNLNSTSIDIINFLSIPSLLNHKMCRSECLSPYHSFYSTQELKPRNLGSWLYRVPAHYCHISSVLVHISPPPYSFCYSLGACFNIFMKLLQWPPN